jgi:hypothetical protein
MPRNNRPRDRPGDEDDDLTRLLVAYKRTETRRSKQYVQPVSAASAQKTYRCPGCALDIDPGTAHIVVWQADGILGDEADLASRRHWHTYCWKVW